MKYSIPSPRGCNFDIKVVEKQIGGKTRSGFRVTGGGIGSAWNGRVEGVGEQQVPRQVCLPLYLFVCNYPNILFFRSIPCISIYVYSLLLVWFTFYPDHLGNLILVHLFKCWCLLVVRSFSLVLACSKIHFFFKIMTYIWIKKIK